MSEVAHSLGGMQIILIPGLWLGAASWDDIVPALRDAGHDPKALTLPGVGADAEASRDLRMADWVDAVVAEIDAAAQPVVVVGHSGGGNVAWGAADARPDRVARVILVDTVPPPPGGQISEFEVVDGVIPFPGWEFFEDEEVFDIDAATRERTAAATLSVPARIPTDEIALHDERRFDVPVTLLMGGMDEETFRSSIAQWGRYADEFGAIRDARVVKLGTGHWPQFSAPARLTEEILAAL